MKLILLCTFLIGMVSSLFSSPSDQTSISIGDQAPDFELEAIGNQKLRLSDNFTLGKNTILVFSRASWCPFCLRQLIEFRRNAEAFKEHNAEVIVVFREESKGIDGLKMIQKRAKSDFTMAIDNDNLKTVAYSQGIGEYSTYIIDQSGTVRGILKGDMRNRVKSQRILDVMESTIAIPA